MQPPSYPVFNSFPATGPQTSPVRVMSDRATAVKVTLAGSTFTARIEVSNATRPDTVPEHLFIPPADTFDSVGTVLAGDPPTDLMGPVRYIRIVLLDGTLTGGNIAESRTHGNTYGTPAEVRGQLDAMQQKLDSQLAANAQDMATLTQQVDAKLAGVQGAVTPEQLQAVQTTANKALTSQYLLSNYQTAADLMTATPPGTTATFDNQGNLTVTSTVKADTTNLLQGGGVYGILRGAATLTGPVLTIQPDADGQIHELMRVDNLMAWGDPAGGDGIRVDVTGKRKMSSALFTQMFGRAQSATGYGLNVVNENDAPAGDNSGSKDGFFASTFLTCAFDGGVKIRGGGDSLTFMGSTITGDKGLDVELNTDVTTLTEASQFMLFACNVTGDAGTIINKGTRTRVVGNNMELRHPGCLNYLGGMVQFKGTNATRNDTANGVSYTEEVQGGTIAWNYMGSGSERPCIELTNANLTHIMGNTLHMGSAAYAVQIHTAARNTIIWPNEWRTAADRQVNDEGVGTMGIWKPVLPLLIPGYAVHASDTAQYIKRPDAIHGAVFLTGRLTGLAKAGNTLFTLPAGFRPAAGRTVILPTIVQVGEVGSANWLTVTPDGKVSLGASVMDTAQTPAPVTADIVLAGSFEAPIV